MTRKNPTPINWKVPVLVLSAIALVTLFTVPLFQVLNRRAKQQEIANYRIPVAFQSLLPHKRYVNVSALPSDLQAHLTAALAIPNQAPLAHGLPARFLPYRPHHDGVEVRVLPHTGDTCDTPNQDLGWLEPGSNSFTVKLCVAKARTMLNLRGEILRNTPMARRLQAYDHPWVCLLAHELMHTDMPEHTQQAGLMYRPSTDTKETHWPRDCPLSQHEINLWGQAVKPFLDPSGPVPLAPPKRP